MIKHILPMCISFDYYASWNILCIVFVFPHPSNNVKIELKKIYPIIQRFGWALSIVYRVRVSILHPPIGDCLLLFSYNISVTVTNHKIVTADRGKSFQVRALESMETINSKLLPVYLPFFVSFFHFSSSFIFPSRFSFVFLSPCLC